LPHFQADCFDRELPKNGDVPNSPLVVVSGAPGPASAAEGKMALCMHTSTSAGAGYRGALEGWAKAGIKYVELNATVVNTFLKTDTLDGARKVLKDNGLTAVHGTLGVRGLLEPNEVAPVV
jgi:hypothetical protein